jgi:hypothetical protein
MSLANQPEDKLIHLWGEKKVPVATSPVTLRVRNQVALMQGYAGMLDRVSPDIQDEILREMAAKTRELVDLLLPFLSAQSSHRMDIEAYREVRRQTRRLVNQYRANLRRAHDQVQCANQSLARGAIGSGSRPRPSASDNETVRL